MGNIKKRIVAYIPKDALVEGRGYRVSFVVEGEPGHQPNGTWPYTGAPGEKLPWFWGFDYEAAVKTAEEYNADRGISKEVADKIIAVALASDLDPNKFPCLLCGKCGVCLRAGVIS